MSDTATSVPLSPPPTYDSLASTTLPALPQTGSVDQRLFTAAYFEPPATRSELVRLSWSSSDHLPSDDDVRLTCHLLPAPGPLAHLPVLCSLFQDVFETSQSPRVTAPTIRRGSSQVNLIDNSTSPSSRPPAHVLANLQSVVIPSFSVLKAITYYNVQLHTGSETLVLKKRYSEFLALKEVLKRVFPQLRGTMGRFPPKSALHQFDPAFLDKRRRRLQQWLEIVLFHPVRWIGSRSQAERGGDPDNRPELTLFRI